MLTNNKSHNRIDLNSPSSSYPTSPNGTSDLPLSIPSRSRQISLMTLVLCCTVAAGVQFGWALQLSLLTPYIQISKLSMIPVVCVMEWIIHSKQYSKEVKIAVIVVVIGVGICTVTDVKVNLKGFICTCVAVLSTSLQQIGLDGAVARPDFLDFFVCTYSVVDPLSLMLTNNKSHNRIDLNSPSSSYPTSPNGTSDLPLSIPSRSRQISLMTLVLCCTVAAGVQFGWALQLSLLTPYIQISKLSMIPVVCVMEWIIHSKQYSKEVKIAVIVVVIGVGICTVTDVKVNLKGFICTCVAVLSTSLQQIVSTT